MMQAMFDAAKFKVLVEYLTVSAVILGFVLCKFSFMKLRYM